jgi:hypothetical protein
VCILVFHYPAYAGSEPSESKDNIGWDVFGSRGGWLHAYLTVNEKYSDNIFYTDSNEDSDFITILSPGILLATPGSEALDISTSKDVPGGITIRRYEKPSFRPFSAYLSYGPEFEIYKDNSDQNTTNHQLEASLQYKLRGGLSVGLFNQYLDTYDPYSTNRRDKKDQDKYKTNITQIDLGYKISPKLNLDLGYSFFWVDYDQNEDDDLNRVDHTGRGYIYFRVRPKVALFSGYELARIDYDKGENRDSIENRFFGGLQWNITEKSRGRIKGGYGVKKFDDSDIDGAKESIFEAQVIYHFTPKTSLRVRGYRRNEESDASRFDYTLTYGARASYLQRITRKITFGMEFWYRNRNYEDDTRRADASRDRKDNDYFLSPYLSYAFRDWFSMHLRYEYEKRDSNEADIDFETNSVLIGFTLKI